MNYTVSLFIPGCNYHGPCSQRGSLGVTGYFTDASGDSPATVNTILNQNNSMDTWQNFYSGPIDVSNLYFNPFVGLFSTSNDTNRTLVVSLLRVTETQALSSSAPAFSPSSTHFASTFPSPSSSIQPSTTSPSVDSQPTHSGLSAGAKAGMGAALGMAGLMIIVLAVLLCLQWRKAQKSKLAVDKRHDKWGKAELHGESVIQPVELEVPPHELGPEEIYEIGSRARAEMDAQEIYELDSRAIIAEAPAEMAS
ncbi:MAG: hypothetical protein M1821_002582 [Bathelium mastoideum]|nr:MAG: hypothetical protein M1821_002582 [Bathelium mastoideum]